MRDIFTRVNAEEGIFHNHQHTQAFPRERCGTKDELPPFFRPNDAAQSRAKRKNVWNSSALLTCFTSLTNSALCHSTLR